MAAEGVRQAFRSNLVRMAIEAGDVRKVADAEGMGATEVKAAAESPPMEGGTTQNVKKNQRPVMIRRSTRSELEGEPRDTG